MKKNSGFYRSMNPIGWALIEHDFEKGNGNIIDPGSCIISMSWGVLEQFKSGVCKSIATYFINISVAINKKAPRNTQS